MGNATERRPTKIRNAEEQMNQTSAAKSDMEHLTVFSLAGGRTPF